MRRMDARTITLALAILGGFALHALLTAAGVAGRPTPGEEARLGDPAHTIGLLREIRDRLDRPQVALHGAATSSHAADGTGAAAAAAPSGDKPPHGGWTGTPAEDWEAGDGGELDPVLARSVLRANEAALLEARRFDVIWYVQTHHARPRPTDPGYAAHAALLERIEHADSLRALRDIVVEAGPALYSGGWTLLEREDTR